jgi:hypothetical protein
MRALQEVSDDAREKMGVCGEEVGRHHLGSIFKPLYDAKKKIQVLKSLPHSQPLSNESLYSFLALLRVSDRA